MSSSAVVVEVEGADPTWFPLIPVDWLPNTQWGTVGEYGDWAAAVLLSAFSVTTADPDYADLQTRISSFFVHAYASLISPILEATWYLYFADPGSLPIPVRIEVRAAEGDTVAALGALVGADEPAPPPELVETPHLGTGIRTMRPLLADTESGELTAAVTYAFRAQEYAADVRVQALSPDFGGLFDAIPELDAFVRCLVPRPAA